MKLSIKYNSKASKWVVLVNRYILFCLLAGNKGCAFKHISRLCWNYIKLAKLLRQFGLKKPLKISKI